MPFPPEVMTALGTVIAALIAGFVAFLVSVFTKETKISEFRQAWIDGLRSDFSEFIAAYHFISSDLEAAVAEPPALNQREYLRSIKDEILKIEQMQARIELRLNPTKHGDIIRQVRELARLEEVISKDFSARKATVEKLIFSVQQLFTDEWRGVKAGELTYRVTKWASLGVVVATVVGGALLWLSV